MTDARDAPSRRYDRAYLLSDVKRNDVLSLDEVVRYGTDSFKDPEYLTVYGLRPAEWYAQGVRLLARTAVECTRDMLADRIARDVAAVIGDRSNHDRSVVVDPFAGSANTLLWLARRLRARHAVGFELDRRVFDATRRNLTIVGFDAELRHVGFEAGLPALQLLGDDLLVVFVAPPWGGALDAALGLDLRRTQPPITTIVDVLARSFARRAVVLAIQVHETVVADSIAAVRARCSWSQLKLYDIDAPGQNHGILLCGWNGT